MGRCRPAAARSTGSIGRLFSDAAGSSPAMAADGVIVGFRCASSHAAAAPLPSLRGGREPYLARGVLPRAGKIDAALENAGGAVCAGGLCAFVAAGVNTPTRHHSNAILRRRDPARQQSADAITRAIARQQPADRYLVDANP